MYDINKEIEVINESVSEIQKEEITEASTVDGKKIKKELESAIDDIQFKTDNPQDVHSKIKKLNKRVGDIAGKKLKTIQAELKKLGRDHSKKDAIAKLNSSEEPLKYITSRSRMKKDGSYDETISLARRLISLLEGKEISEAISSSDAKALLDGYQAGNSKDEKKLRKELKKSHTEIVKNFDKSVKAFMDSEAKRLKKEFPDYDVTVSKVSKRVLKDVSGNSNSQFGDWYDNEEYRIAITNKF